MRIDQSYNEWASSYDTNINKTRDLDRLVTMAVLEDIPFNHVLELGCGTGKNTAWLLTKARNVHALDFSKRMLAEASVKITSEKVKFQQADINNPWPCTDDTFDLITANLVLEHIKNLKPIFQQAYDKLQAEGYFFLAELHPGRQYKGSQAKFEKEDGTTHLLEVFTHHISDYLIAAKDQGFQLLQLEEWFDGERGPDQIPRLLSFLFQKNY